MKEVVEKFALKNAIDYGGKVNEKAVLGKILGTHPEFRSDIKKVVETISKVKKGVEKLSISEQRKKLEKISPELLTQKKEVKEKKLSLGNPKKVVMRFAPSPSGPLHLGHAYVLSLNSELCRIHKGTLILRIEDTNPANIYDKAYSLIPEDADWVTKGNVSQVVIQSDRLKYYYKYAEELVSKDAAYVCNCNPDKYKRLLSKGKECPCRSLDVKEQLARYKKMFDEYKAGEVVLRLKTDITHKNPAMRDFSLMRINEFEHPRQKLKYRVWPLMNLAVAIDDHLLGVTHTLRAKDHRDNEKRQEWIYNYLGWKKPEALYVGRINFTDLQLSSSETKKLILAKKYDGWDDIRLPFLPALKRRGYVPDVFMRYAHEVGVSENDKKVSKQEFFKTINNSNKDVLDPLSNRYFFVEDPTTITIKNAPKQKVAIRLHPDYHKRGNREFHTATSFLITKKDLKQLSKGRIHRLMDCLNFEVKDDGFVFHSTDYETYKNHDKKGKIIHWLPKEDETVDVTIILESGEKVKGKAEHRVKELKENTVVQFERFGFCRLDKKKKNNIEFWFAHR